MRLQLKLKTRNSRKIIPIDYQYYISAWIYKVLKNADSSFSDFLHNTGYKEGNKTFKFFCYSPLNLGKVKVWKDRSLLEFYRNEISLGVSFLLPDGAGNFVKGLFVDKEFYLGDHFIGVDFSVVDVVEVEEDTQNNTMRYRLISPAVVSYQNENDRYAKYLSPRDQNYDLLVKNNLCARLKVWDSSLNVKPSDIHFNALNEPRKGGRLIRTRSKNAIKIIGYKYDFEITAPAKVHQLILNSGLGEKNSQGFGWCECV